MSHMNIVFMQKNFISIISVIYMAFAHTFHANSQGDYNGIVNPFVTYSYEKMTFDLNALTQRYPMILTGEKIGYSLERRTIPAVRFAPHTNLRNASCPRTHCHQLHYVFH